MKLRIIAALIIVAPVGCHSRDPRPPLVAGAVSKYEAAAIAAQLADLLDEQADAWNHGDLQGFMSFYWHSDELTFVSGERVIRGWQATLERYKKRYPTPLEMGWLDFRDLQSNAHSADQALVTGRWRVQAHRGGKTGRFTLTFRKIEGRWLIIHDHTTTDESDNSRGHQSRRAETGDPPFEGLSLLPGWSGALSEPLAGLAGRPCCGAGVRDW